MTLIRPVVLTLFVLAAVFAFGQKNYVTGKIKRNSGVEETGQIDYKNWDKNPTKINFKTASGEVVELSLGETDGFEVTRSDNFTESYKKAIVEVDKSPHTMEELEYNPSPSFELDTVFLMELFRGDVNLFYLKDERGKIHFFYSTVNSLGTKELVQKRYRQEGSATLYYSNQYIAQLRALVVDCSPTAQIINEKLRYDVRPMVAAVKAINECLGGETLYVFAEEKLKTAFYVAAGAGLTQLRFDNFYGTNQKIDFETSLVAALGLGLDYYISRTNKRFSFSNELFFSHFQAKKEVVDDSSPNDPVYYRESYKAAYLRLNTMIKWRFSKWKAKPFLLAGFSNGAILGFKQSGEIERNVFGEARFFPYTPLASVRKYEQGMLMGFGTSFFKDKMSISARFSISNGMSANKSYRTLIRSGFVLVGYSF